MMKRGERRPEGGSRRAEERRPEGGSQSFGGREAQRAEGREVPCSLFLQGGGECFQGGGLDGGFVQVMEPGFIVNPPDRFRQTGRNIFEADLQGFDDGILYAFLAAFLS